MIRFDNLIDHGDLYFDLEFDLVDHVIRWWTSVKIYKKIRDTLFLACFQAQLKVALHVLACFYAKYITYLFIRMYIKQEDLTQWIRHFCSQCQFRKVRDLGEAAFTRKPIDHQHGERWSIDIM